MARWVGHILSTEPVAEPEELALRASVPGYEVHDCGATSSLTGADQVAAYEAALREDPRLAVAHYNRATVLYRMGKFSEAEAGFVKAAELDSCNEEFKLGLSACREALRPLCET